MSTTLVEREAIRALAAQHIQEVGLDRPPFDYRASLTARQLTLLPDPLQEILAHSDLPAADQEKIDGFIHLEQRIVCLRDGLHPHQHRTGVLHEVAHDVIPWQRELLHYCPIFSLPNDVQVSFEREANLFAAECCFFASRFSAEVNSLPHHLRSAVALTKTYSTSYEATFRQYVECHPETCLLLVSTLVSADQGQHGALWAVRQYIASPSAALRVRGRVGHRFSSPELTALLSVPGLYNDVVEHELRDGDRTHAAQSFWNSYKLFTLLWL